MNGKQIMGIFLIVGVLALSGCTSKPTYSGEPIVDSQTDSPPTTTQPAPQPVAAPVKEVATIDLFSAKIDSWDADPEGDGIEVTIDPKDKDDKQVKVEGMLNARVYEKTFDYSTYDTEKGDLVKEWNNIPIGKEYGFLGTTARLEFEDGFDYEKAAGLYGLYLEVDFIYSGKTYTAVKDSVIDLSNV